MSQASVGSSGQGGGQKHGPSLWEKLAKILKDFALALMLGALVLGVSVSTYYFRELGFDADIDAFFNLLFSDFTLILVGTAIAALLVWFGTPILKPQIQNSEEGLKLRYFEEILGVEFEAINRRRKHFNDMAEKSDRLRAKYREHRYTSRGPVRRDPNARPTSSEWKAEEGLFDPFGPGGDKEKRATVDPDRPIYEKTRPRPIPCDANGLALSGGGIRSAAVCLGALQALNKHGVLQSVDYLSTVSGGGYIGSCLSAAATKMAFPFGDDDRDNPPIMHLRNYSNYLMPRGRSIIRNGTETAAIFLRGWIANACRVVAALLGLVLLTWIAYPNVNALTTGNFFARLASLLADGVAQLQWPPSMQMALPALYHETSVVGLHASAEYSPFAPLMLAAGLFTIFAVSWVVVRSLLAISRSELTNSPGIGDAEGRLLAVTRWLLIVVIAIFAIDLQPLVMSAIDRAHDQSNRNNQAAAAEWLKFVIFGLFTLAFVTAMLSSWLGHALAKSSHSGGWTQILGSGVVRTLFLIAALALPFGLWGAYLLLSLIGMEGSHVLSLDGLVAHFHEYAFLTFLITLTLTAIFDPNAYSLHRLYRDRLSKAFLFDPQPGYQGDPPSLSDVKLSHLLGKVEAPYHIINAAMNVQGSKEANRRGRDADFFIFTPAFIGSELTSFAPTNDRLLGARARDIETTDPALNLASAMAISGAAVSANMGPNTVRLFSPTLALLNFRLGYWLRNPRDLAKNRGSFGNLRRFLARAVSRHFYLIFEMFNLLDETRPYVYLTDGGHLENLGGYELLKRGCKLIIVIDAEADPSMSFGSLLKLERFARIDLGIRISLPWENIARTTLHISDAVSSSSAPIQVGWKGPHCAVGRIHYADGVDGVLLYFKSSLSGDEKDYILDYKKRHPQFPHETTGDQFFSEEQFEMYRALGYHMVDGFFSQTDQFAFLSQATGAWANQLSAFNAVSELVPEFP